MSVCAPISREELFANFLELPASVTDNLRTLIIGADYSVHLPVLGTSTGLIGPYNAIAGVVGGWPSLGVNETVDLANASGVVEDALINYFTEVGVPAIANGRQYLAIPNAIQHNAGATIWSGPNYTVALNIPVVIGDYVTIINGVNTFSSLVTGFTYITGEPRVLLLADNLPAWAIGGSFFNVSLSQVVASLTLSSSNLTLTSTTFTANSGITLTTDRTGNTAYPLIGATNYSQVYASYRAFDATLAANGVMEVRTELELAAFFDDYTDPNSGLGFAVWQALAPTLTITDIVYPKVLFVALPNSLTASWQAVITRVARRRDWYTVAPLTTNASILALFVPLLQLRQSISLDSRMVAALPLVTESTIFAGGATATVDQSLTPGVNRTVTRDGGAAAPFTGALPGDLVTVAGVTVVIATVISAQTVTVTTSLAPGVGLVLNSVIHPFNAAETATAYYTQASAYDNRSISIVFPTNPTWQNVVVGGELLAAVTAGLRGYTSPQQSLKGVILVAGWAVPSCVYEFLGELPALGDNGCFVYEACETDLTRAVVLFANTTDQSSTINGREGLVANTDAIRRYFKDLSACYEGRVKVTQATLTAIRRSYVEAIQFLLSNTQVPVLGPILVSGVVGRVQQDPNAADIVIVPIDIVISTVIDQLNVTVNVSIQVV